MGLYTTYLIASENGSGWFSKRISPLQESIKTRIWIQILGRKKKEGSMPKGLSPPVRSMILKLKWSHHRFLLLEVVGCHDEQPYSLWEQLLPVGNEVGPGLGDALESADGLGRDTREDLHQGEAAQPNHACRGAVLHACHQERSKSGGFCQTCMSRNYNKMVEHRWYLWPLLNTRFKFKWQLFHVL